MMKKISWILCFPFLISSPTYADILKLKCDMGNMGTWTHVLDREKGTVYTEELLNKGPHDLLTDNEFYLWTFKVNEKSWAYKLNRSTLKISHAIEGTGYVPEGICDVVRPVI